MRLIGDFHIHSKYSRATSPNMDLGYLDLWGQIKGIDVISVGDFTHPVWFKEIKEKLEPVNGLFRLKNKYKIKNNDFPKILKNDLRFILTTEISCIYSKNNKVRKIHIIVFAPDFEAVEKINVRLGRIGNLHSDGRPILGLDAKELAKIVFGASTECLVIPAHAWTPWFSIFGSKSGFNAIEECFDEYAKHIFAVETGLSSDPAMNRRLSKLDDISLISNSDAHSLHKIGREANVFEVTDTKKTSYADIARMIREKNPKEFIYTVEFFPEEGKYHYDGHRNCGIIFSPKESKASNNLCPKCKHPLTIGVMNRVDELADRNSSKVPRDAVPFKNLVPLEEIIGDVYGVGTGTKTVFEKYKTLINGFNDEFNILLDAPIKDIAQVSDVKIAEGVKRVREGKLNIIPGYDGEYGKISIFSDKEKKRVKEEK
ncbi:MAG: DNA helicase UvrD [Parcubacteria group bacterium GW2011_GWA2_38_13b]|nr:MAG: DNA helicase UvrD [Parcubacteria group bacterium GW2011_GWA2_38_13b]